VPPTTGFQNKPTDWPTTEKPRAYNVCFTTLHLGIIFFILLQLHLLLAAVSSLLQKETSNGCSQQDRRFDAAALGAAVAAHSGPTRATNWNIGGGPRPRIPDPNDYTQQRANSNDHASSPSAGATTPGEYDNNQDYSFCCCGFLVRSGGERRGGAGRRGRWRWRPRRRRRPYGRRDWK
jgi:hypothetical protein